MAASTRALFTEGLTAAATWEFELADIAASSQQPQGFMYVLGSTCHYNAEQASKWGQDTRNLQAPVGQPQRAFQSSSSLTRDRARHRRRSTIRQKQKEVLHTPV
eukprot:1918102-Amphidinium_carterae.2